MLALHPEFLIQTVWGWGWEFTFLKSSYCNADAAGLGGPHFENHYYIKTVSQKCVHTALQKQAIYKSQTFKIIRSLNDS